jgi:hypothetical protein
MAETQNNEYPLTHAQARRYERFLAKPDNRYLFFAWHIETELKAQEVAALLGKVIKAHSVFSVTVHKEQGKYYQRQNLQYEPIVNVIDIDIEKFSSDPVEQEKVLMDYFSVEQWDPESLKMTQNAILRDSNGRLAWIHCTEHFIYDAYSHFIVLRDLIKALREKCFIIERRPSFFDYCAHESRYIGTKEAMKQSTEWVRKFGHGLSEMVLTGRLRPSNSTVSAVKSILIEESQLNKLKKIGGLERLTLNDMFLEIMLLTLRSICRVSNVSLVTFDMNRKNPDFLKTVGWFANPLLVGCDFSGSIISENIKQARKSKEWSYERSSLPFQYILRELAKCKAERSDENVESIYHATMQIVHFQVHQWPDDKILSCEEVAVKRIHIKQEFPAHNPGFHLFIYNNRTELKVLYPRLDYDENYVVSWLNQFQQQVEVYITNYSH